jgi:hypothetical protein
MHNKDFFSLSLLLAEGGRRCGCAPTKPAVLRKAPTDPQNLALAGNWDLMPRAQGEHTQVMMPCAVVAFGGKQGAASTLDDYSDSETGTRNANSNWQVPT